MHIRSSELPEPGADGLEGFTHLSPLNIIGLLKPLAAATEARVVKGFRRADARQFLVSEPKIPRPMS